MLFNSYEFIFLFLPITLFGFYYFGHSKRYRLAIGWLFLASLLYYGWWNPIYLLLIIGSMVFNYGIGVYLGKHAHQSKKRSKTTLALGVFINLALLGYYKYTFFVLNNINFLFGRDWSIGKILLPLGISFFTFQQIAYLVDAYQGKAKEYNFSNYCLFVTFFPQLIAGPIVHHQEILPQYNEEETYRFSQLNFAIGWTIFSIGLFKKVMLADTLALYATPVFDAALNGKSLSPLTAWVGTLCYSFQIYFDFSGYSDMAIGLGRMFNIKLPQNFNSPYKARSIIDFWHRWHMTLSRFLRDYLYYPLGGNRKGRFRRYFNLTIVMLLGGLWHGASWNFVLWGGIHGIFLMINHAWRHITKDAHPTILASKGSKLSASVITFLAVVLSWVLFRAESLGAVAIIYKGMFGLNQIDTSGIMITSEAIMSIVVAVLIVWILPNAQEFMHLFKPTTDYDKERSWNSLTLFKHCLWQPKKRWAIVFTILFLISVANMLKVTEFLYYQF